MKIIKPSYILTPNALLRGKAVAYEERIVAIDDFSALRKRFADATLIEPKRRTLLMPGLINAHVHLEFSANKTTLEYGSFVPWLHSVIQERETLINGCDTHCMQKACDTMLANGITTFGAISSYAKDLEAAANAKQNVIFFTELIGSQAAMADALFSDFLARLDMAKSIDRKGFIPAIAVHSPYSVHPILIRKALEIAKKESLHVSAHFLESSAEKEWCDNNEGAFAEFFKTFLNQERAVNTSDAFLSLFDDTPTLLTHGIFAQDEALQRIKKARHTVVHCPISNRLLGNGALDIERLNKLGIDWIVATDGLGSNYTLDLFEEMKIALFMQHGSDIAALAKQLVQNVTCNAAKALGVEKGEIREGKDADMLLLELDEEPNEQIALHLILQRYNIIHTIINGESICIS